MILPDLNLLIYAYNKTAPDHEAARVWWEDIMTRQEAVGLPLTVALGFVRLMTNPKVIQPPLPLADAIAEVKRWFSSGRRRGRTRRAWAEFGAIRLERQGMVRWWWMDLQQRGGPASNALHSSAGRD
jgi:toxin-antitoxin system PIN domain toxin